MAGGGFLGLTSHTSAPQGKKEFRLNNRVAKNRSMQKFIDYIKSFSLLSFNDIETIKEQIYIEKFGAKSFIHEAGKVCQRIGFINRGITCSYFYDSNGKEIIKGFHAENQFVLDLISYQKSIESNQYIQTITDCELVFISKSSDEFLSKNIDKWSTLIRKVSDALLSEKLENQTILLHKSAKERYLSFMKNYPNLINVVPLGQLASYLGIAQQSLSRIRKEIIS